MSNEFELDDLARHEGYNADSEARSSPSSPRDDDKDSTAASWSWAGAGILSLWSAVFILFPRFLLFAAEEGQALTPLESFLALHFGLLLVGTAIALITNIPSDHPLPAREQRDPPTHPLLYPVTGVSLVSSFFSYNTPDAGGLPVVFSLCTGIIGVWGLWAITFAGASLISKKTGADKHTSAFLFGNKASASKQKKAWRKEQKTKAL